MAYDSPPHVGNRRDDPFAQVLETLRTLTDQVGTMQRTMATREDLKELVSKAEYNADRRADVTRIADHAQRITAIEQGMTAFNEKLHAVEVADALRFSQTQAAQQGTAQQGAATTAAVASLSANQLRLLYWIMGLMGTGLIMLLGALLGHAVYH